MIKEMAIAERKMPAVATGQIFNFIREETGWYIDVPGYLDKGNSKADLEMADGAGKLLNILAKGRSKLRLRLATEPFAGADVLTLMEHCPAPEGGAIYMLESCEATDTNCLLWICDIALFIFGDMPAHIYFQKLSVRPYPA